MSGQPYKTKLDMTNARNAYLDNLKLRVELDDKNYQANKLYARTGQLPVEMTDYRSTTEKIADVQRLKIDLNSKLLTITDGQQAQSITTQLGNDQLIFLSQNFGPIAEQMKKMYSLGVLAPIFITYLDRYMDRFQQTRGVELGLQQTAANNIIANQQTILNTMAKATDINNIIRLIMTLGNQNMKINKSVTDNLNDLNEIIKTIPQIINQISQENNAIQQSQMQQILNNIIADLPNRDQMNVAFTELTNDIRENNREGIITVLNQLQGMTELGQDTKENIEILKKMIQEYKPSQSKEQKQSDLPIKENLTEEESNQLTEIMAEYSGKSREELLTEFNDIWDTSKEEITSKYKNKTEYCKTVIAKRYSKNLSKIDLLNLIQDLQTILNFNVIDYSGIKRYNISPDTARPTETPLPIGKGMRGRGIIKMTLARKYPSQVLETDIDYTMAVIKAPKFVPIGKHLINKHRLDDNIIAIKRNGGSVIPSLPSQRVSKNVANIVRKILHGKTPEYDDYNELNNDDKLILDKIAKETQIKDRLQLPKPNKDEQDKDVNQFEILKGEILAGNDNPDIVKKFKTIILKLSHQNLLPKGQAKELLMDLINLGH
jgi:hypothetical protein